MSTLYYTVQVADYVTPSVERVVTTMLGRPATTEEMVQAMARVDDYLARKEREATR